ncbi:MAG TPA: glucose 1-dehydrogenase [Anaerolineales bacterium]
MGRAADRVMTGLPSLFRLDQQVAIVTGGGRGLGLAMAQALSEAGAAVAIFEVDRETGQAAAEGLTAAGGRSWAMPVDVGRADQIEAALDRCEAELGQPTILVNNAGVTSNSPFEDLPADDWQRVIDINLGGVFRTTQALGRRLMEGGAGGSIINVASISGLVGNRGGNNSHYCASKGGVIALTRSLAIEWAPHGIRLNAIAPGYFVTPMTDQLRIRDARFYQELVDRVPLGRFGQGSDLAGAVVFLASQASAFVTGHTLVVDGGYTAW